MILPRSSGILLSSNMASQAPKRNFEPRPPAHVDTVGNSVRSRSRVFLQSNEVIKLSLINSPLDVIRSLLNKSQNFFLLIIMPRAFWRAWKMVPQYSQSLVPDSSSFSKVWPSSSVTALRVSTGFLLRQARWPFLQPEQCLFLFASKGGLRPQFHVFQDFHEQGW